MIPRAYITEWRAVAPWSQDAWVEQDLVISRALVALFSVAAVAERLAFRGGTALYKLHLRPPARYSEDIDLVQVRSEPIGATLDLVRGALDPWLGTSQHRLSERTAALVYRFDSEDDPPLKMRLKIEIDTREHFSALGLTRVPFRVESRWFRGDAEVGTKLRALYQRNKGRDLFDLWFALAQGIVNTGALFLCFQRYMAEGGHTVTRAQFEMNLHEKARSPGFRRDILPLLRPDPNRDFDIDRGTGHRAGSAHQDAAWRTVAGESGADSKLSAQLDRSLRGAAGVGPPVPCQEKPSRETRSQARWRSSLPIVRLSNTRPAVQHMTSGIGAFRVPSEGPDCRLAKWMARWDAGMQR